jgi:hypothetical protein
MIVDRDRYASIFIEDGCQYYIAARFAMRAALMPVMGNLFHHAIEQFLKGGLARKRDMHELKDRKKAGHDLNKLWKLFKEDFQINDLTKHDRTVVTLNMFEDIRYPEKIVELGMEATADWLSDINYTNSFPPTQSPKYRIVVSEIDELVTEIFKKSSWNPRAFFQKYPSASEVIRYQNQYANFLFGIESKPE